MNKDAQFWNNKWQQAPITYTGRVLIGGEERIVCDVKDFITANDAILEEVIHDYRLRKHSYNASAHAIQQFVVNFLEYAGDEESSKCPEFWQFPFETLQSGVGDCEDGGILMASLMIQVGIPAYRVKMCAGYVQEAPTAPQGGHAYCIYLADQRGGQQNWVVLDWCYYEDSEIAPKNKPLAKHGGYNGCYKDLWFTFNNEYSWNQAGLEIDAQRISRKQSGGLTEKMASGTAMQSVMTKIKTKIKAHDAK